MRFDVFAEKEGLQLYINCLAGAVIRRANVKDAEEAIHSARASGHKAASVVVLTDVGIEPAAAAAITQGGVVLIRESELHYLSQRLETAARPKVPAQTAA